MSRLRLFFALWPEEAMQRALALAARERIGEQAQGRPVPARNLHLTLAFLGNVPEERLEALRGAVAPATHAVAPPVTVEFRQLEFWRRAQLVCAAPEPSERASALAQALRKSLLGAGFAPDDKPFRPHVTLVRHAERAPSERALAPVAWSFGAFALVESRTEPAGSIYSVLESWQLCGEAESH